MYCDVRFALQTTLHTAQPERHLSKILSNVGGNSGHTRTPQGRTSDMAGMHPQFLRSNFKTWKVLATVFVAGWGLKLALYGLVRSA